MENKNDIGNAIKYYRDLKNMSQTQLAAKIGVSQRNVSYYESGEHIPPADILKKLADIFGISVDVLIGNRKIGASDNCYYYLYEDGQANWAIRKKAEEKGIQYEDALDRTCIPKERFDSLWYGDAQPYAEELIRFSNVLDVSTDFLLDISQHERYTSDEDLILRYYGQNKEEVMELLGSFSSLSKRDRTILLGKCFELEDHSNPDSSVAAEEPQKKVSGK